MNSNYRMLIDIDSCSGCHACSVSCKAEHRAPFGQFRHKVQYVENGAFPKVERAFIPTLCQHCEDAPCISACGVEAIVSRETGVIVIEEDVCIGAGQCVEACPYGAIFINDDHKAIKCDFCEERVKNDEQPACVSTCPTDAILFGYENDLHIQQALKLGNYKTWEPVETTPRVMYKGLSEKIEKKLIKINRD